MAQSQFNLISIALYESPVVLVTPDFSGTTSKRLTSVWESVASALPWVIL